MVKTSFIKLQQLLYNFLKSTHGNFSCFLPYDLGRIKSFILRRIFSSIRMEKEQMEALKDLPNDAIIVFVTKYKSNFEFLFAHTRHKELMLPIPQVAFDYNIYFFQPFLTLIKILVSHIIYLIKYYKFPNPYITHYYKMMLESNYCGFLSLIENKGFYLRFVKKRKDPLLYLIEIQKEIKSPIYMVPQLMFFDKKPTSFKDSLVDVIFGSIRHPGNLRKIINLVRSPGKIFVELSQPVDLQSWLNRVSNKTRSMEYQALALRHDLLFQHNCHRQTITGPTLKSREEVKEAILTNQKMRKFMKDYAESKQTPLRNVSKKAHYYLNEIAARYNPSSIKMMSHAVNWIVNSTFDGAVVDKEGLKKVKQMSRQGPIILVPCHKSHVDYLVLSAILYHNDMPCPHIAAGKNLSFWPLGPIFRSGGAFFIRRSFRGQKLYTKILSEYIHKLLEEGFNIEMFIEGGRSRTGKLLTPKLGFISILIDAFRNGACKDMFFVPIYIGYDRIIEEYAYIHETEGGNKRPENLKQVIKARKFLKKRYGKIYINFHEPISIKDLLSNQKFSLLEAHESKYEDVCYDVGRRIMISIDKETVITPHGLTAAAILNLSQSRFNCGDIVEIANSYLFFAISQGAKIADTLILSPDKALKNAFEECKRRKLIENVQQQENNRNEGSQNTVCTIKNNKRSLLDFYKNNCISYFVHGSIVALVILEEDAFQFCTSNLHERHKMLTNFFRYEFAIDLEKPSEYFVRKTIKAFIDSAMLMPHKTIPDTYNITSSGYRKLKLYAAFLKPYFESYIVVLKFIKRDNKKVTNIDVKEKIKKIQSVGLQMYKRGEIDLLESISKVTYSNGIKLFSDESNLYKGKNIELIRKYCDDIAKKLKLISK